MPVNRIIRQINLRKSDSVILIYGQVNDTFVTKDLSIYNIDGIEKIVCRYLRDNGYEQVIFYAPERQLYTYDEQSYYNCFPKEDMASKVNRRQASPIIDGRPLGNNKLLRSSNIGYTKQSLSNTNTTNSTKEARWHREGFIPVVTAKSDIAIVDILREALFQKKHKSAVIFSQFDDPSINSEIQRLVIPLIPRLQRRTNDNKCIIITNAVDQEKLKEVVDSVPALNKIVKMEDAGRGLDSLIYIGYPHKDEIGNLLNYLRFKKNLNVDWYSFKKLVVGLDQYRDQLKRWETDFRDLKKIDIQSINAFLDSPISTDDKTAFKKLQSLIGLDNVKSAIRRHILQIQDIVEQNIKERPLMHICLKGNPGTGKTTIARLIADIFKEANLLDRGHLVEVDRQRLVAGYIGQTAIKTDSCCREALGGVLFVDEAYSLAQRDDSESVGSGGSQDFGQEAIDTLIKRMTDWQDRFCVILAGYPDEMDHLLSRNPGFTGRIGLTVEIDDYTANELTEIFYLKASNSSKMVLPEFKEHLENLFTELYRRRGKKFDNARTVEQLFNKISGLHLERCFTQNLDRRIEPFRFEDIPKELAQKVSKTKPDASALERLQALVGLDKAKSQIKKQLAMVEAGRNYSKYSGGRRLHLVFKGNPGTGKTTVARLVGEIYQDYQILSNNVFVETSRHDLVGGYQGQTAPKVEKICKEAKGGVLFIDEAYTLVQGENDNFGAEAIDTLLKIMEDEKDNFCVIVAGYPKQMDDFLDSNPGLKRRFATEIEFEDYGPVELFQIFEIILGKKGVKVEKSLNEKIKLILESLYDRRDENFGNAGEVENLIQKIIENHALRCLNLELSIQEAPVAIEDIPEEKLSLLPVKNSEEVVAEALRELNNLIGLKEVKDHVDQLIKEYRHNQIRQLHNPNIALDKNKRNYHMIFKGNPGTGKTTVARIMGKVFKALDILKKGDVIEVTRADFVAGYLGQTSEKTKKLIKRSFDNILFIDEAYSLVNGVTDSFGTEAIETLLKMMEDHRDRIVVIAAGYPREMRIFLRSNSGLSSRFPNEIEFKDYTSDEMLEILKLTIKAEGYRLQDGLDNNLKSLLLIQKSEKTRAYGNARDIKNYFYQRILPLYMERIEKLEPDNPEYWAITSKDIPNIQTVLGEKNEEGDNEEFSPKKEIVQRRNNATKIASSSATGSGDIVHGNKVINNSFGKQPNSLPYYITDVPGVNESELILGRDKDAEIIHSKLFNSNTPNILLLHGLPGVGKSRTVVKFIKTYEESFEHLIWLNASDGLKKGFFNAKIEDVLGIEYKTDETDEKRFSNIIKKINDIEGPILFVLEDVSKQVGEELKNLPLKNNKIILISRERLDFNNRHKINVLDKPNAIKLFHSYCPQKKLQEENLEQLLDSISYHPYAIKLVSTTLANKISLNNFLDDSEFSKDYLKLIVDKINIPHANSNGKIIDVFKSLFGIWELQTEELECLIYFSVLPSQPFSFEFLKELFLIHEGEELIKFEKVILGLEAKALLIKDSNNNFYCHKIIQQVCRESVEINPTKLSILLTSLGIELGRKIDYSYSQYGIYDLLNTYLPILETFLNFFNDREQLSINRVYINLSIFYRINGQFEDSIRISNEEKVWLEPNKEGYPHWYSILLRNIGFSNSLQGNNMEAEDCYIKAASFLESIELNEHPYLEKIEQELVNVYSLLGKSKLSVGTYDIENAISYFEKGLSLFESKKIEAPLALANTKEGLAMAYLEIGDFERGIKELNQVKEIYIDELKVNKEALVIGYLDCSLAIAYSGNQNFPNSSHFASSAKSILDKHLPNDSIDFIRIYNVLVLVVINDLLSRRDRGEYDADDHKDVLGLAEKNILEAIRLTQIHKGKNHPDLAITYSNYSLLLNLANKFDLGYQNALKGLSLLKKSNIENAVLIGLYMRIFVFFEDQTTFELAEEGMLLGLKLIPDEQELQLERGYLYYCLGILKHNAGASRDGIDSINTALTCVRTFYNKLNPLDSSDSEDSPLEVVCLEEIAKIYYEIDDLSGALNAQREAIDLCEKNMPLNDEEFAERYVKMSQISLKAAQQFGDMKLYAEALEFREKTRSINSTFINNFAELEDFARLYLVKDPKNENNRVCIIIPTQLKEKFSKDLQERSLNKLSEYGYALQNNKNEGVQEMIKRYSKIYGDLDTEFVKTV